MYDWKACGDSFMQPQDWLSWEALPARLAKQSPGKVINFNQLGREIYVYRQICHTHTLCGCIDHSWTGIAASLVGRKFDNENQAQLIYLNTICLYKSCPNFF